jgi:hypothetical protein
MMISVKIVQRSAAVKWLSYGVGKSWGLGSVDPQMANSPDICVMLKILSSEYQLYACGKIFRMH